MPPPPVLDRTATLTPRAAPEDDSDCEEPATRQPETDDPERYEQIGEHARGGLGRIVRAIDRRLGRTVAVKELLRRGSSSSAANEARFLREALITARLEHPGIVPVHEAGRWPNGDPYYVMKLVEGRTLKELIAERSQLRERLGLLPHVIAIADAVGYAHSEGVIHRDIKPSNVIVGAFGETIVVDWGLACDRKQDLPELVSELTAGDGLEASSMSGKVVGTPAYMAPEQARGEAVDERADVYAIGAVLYEVLGGEPPHQAETPQGTIDRVLAGPPRPLGAVVAHVPVELATIVGKAMARSPEDRYANATTLAEDLRRFQTGKLVSAHSYTAWSLVRKKLSQHRSVVAVALASAVALGAVGVESFRRVVNERNNARHERASAVDARSQAEHRQRELVLLQAVTALRKDPTATLAWLKDYKIADTDREQVLDVVDEAIALGVARHVFRPGDWVLDAVFTPSGDTLVVAVRGGGVRVFDLASGLERVLAQSDRAAEVLAMSPTGDFVVGAGSHGDVTVWPLDGGTPRTIARISRVPAALLLSADGMRVLVRHEVGPPEIAFLDGRPPQLLAPKTAMRSAVAAADWTRQAVTTARNQVAVVDGETMRPLARTEKAITWLAISPRGDIVLIHDGSTLWKVPYAGGKIEKLASYGARISQIMWAPGERALAIGGDLHDIRLVDVSSGATRELRGHTDAIYTLQWTRDGRRLLSASDDATARVWNIADGTSTLLRGHDDDVFRARFSGDEHQVVTASLDGSARVWRLAEPGARVLAEGRPIEGMWLGKDRALVKTSSEVAWWNLASGHRVPVFSWAQDQKGLGYGMPSKDGERLVVPAGDFSIEVRQRAGHAVVLRGHTGVVTHVQFGHDNTSLYTSAFDGSLRRWNLATGEGTVLVNGEHPVRWFAVAANGRMVAQIGEAAVLIAPDPTTGEARPTRTLGQGDPWCIASGEFETVGGRLVMRRCDRSLALLDGERVIELPSGGYQVARTAVSPDGTRIAGAVGDRTVRVWDASTGSLLETLRGHSDLPLDVAFSPDGTLLASSSYDRTVRIWQVGAGRQRILRGHTGAVDRVAWRDATHLVTGGRDGTLRMWDLPSMTPPPIEELRARLDATTSARIASDRPATTSGNPPRRRT